MTLAHPPGSPTTGAPPARRAAAVAACCALVLATLALVTAAAPPAGASHYRATQLSWQQASGTTVNFTATASWRCTFYALDCDSTPSPPGTPFGSDAIAFGDGGFSDGTWRVVSIDHVNNSVTAIKQVSRTYAGTGPYTASIATCCRLGGPLHRNNPGGSVRVETVVDLARTSASPVSSIPPVVDCGLNAVCSFTIPASDPDGQALRFRLSTPTEASGSTSGFRQPGPTLAPNAASVTTGGLYQWDTTGAAVNTSGDTYYSTQVMVENLAATGAVISKTAVDFFIRLTTSPNLAPVFTAPTPADGTTFTVPAGAPFSFGVRATDADAGDTVTLGIVGQPAGSSFAPTAGNPATGTFSWTPAAAGTYLMNLTAQDPSGRGAVPRSITIVVTSANRDPSAGAGGPYTGSEGSPVPVSGTASDPDAADTVTTAWTVAGDPANDTGASCTVAAPAALSTTVTCNDDGTYTLTLTATDNHGATATSTAALTVANVAPTVDITSPADGALYAVGATVSLAGTVADAGANDVPACSVNWDDGAGAVAAGTAAGGTCSASRAFTAPGVYTVTLAADDGDGGSGSDAVMIVVYDPSAGFVTGGGWIQSPAGAWAGDRAMSGKANFGFVSKYRKGATVPEGQTEFVFHAADLNFHSDSYQWLVVSGAKAQYKGQGSINGVPGYSFLVTVTDGQVSGGGGADRIRMKIWNAGGTVYDNATSSDDLDASDTQALGGGSIVIHAPRR